MKRNRLDIMQSPLAPFVALLANLLLAFGLYIVARIEFLFENYNYFCAVLRPLVFGDCFMAATCSTARRYSTPTPFMW